MDRQMLSAIAHRDHPIAAPMSAANLYGLLRRAALPAAGARVLDLGCGSGEWVIRALELTPSAVADGVDISPHAVEAAARAADARGVSERLSLHTVPAAEFPAAAPYDLVLCVGSTHAFGGLAGTMAAIARHVRPGGLALVGEGFWERPPHPELTSELGEYGDLPGTVEEAESGGWVTVHGHVSSLAEWDEYEWSWTGTLARWAADNPGPDGDQALAAALEHRALWLTGYRGVLGFVTLLLRRT